MFELTLLLVGVAAGALSLWIITKNKLYISARDLQQLRAESDNIRNETDKLRNKLSETEKENTILSAHNQNLNNRISDLLSDIMNHRTTESKFHDKIILLEKANSELSLKNELYKKEIQEIKERMKLEFENIANRILEDKSRRFTETNRENISGILKPLADNLENFKKKIDETYDKEAKERFSLGREIEKLVFLNQRLSEEANNLTNALRGNSKMQGDWGEMILENILEKSGLTRNREYFIQETLRDGELNAVTNEEGRRMIPDVLIKYPDGRNLIIDSKVSLTAYINYCSSTDGVAYKKYCGEHIASVKRHIDELSHKNYQDYTDSLGFVMMFIPNEPAYHLALKEEQDIWNYAYAKRVLLMSPTNLITSLKLIEDMWYKDKQERNAIKIAEEGGKLYDKFVGFADTLHRLGENIRRTNDSYEDAMKQLKYGKGDLLTKVDNLRKLGVKAKKRLAVKNTEEISTDN